MRSIKTVVTSIIALGLACATPVFAEPVDAVEGLKACAEITDQDARYACFDELAERVVGDKPDTASRSPTPAAAPEVKEEPETDIRYSGLITSCKKGYYGNWFFYFEDGQIWQEVNKKNRRFKDCRFNAVITKDIFGYKMLIEGQGRTFRVKRNR